MPKGQEGRGGRRGASIKVHIPEGYDDAWTNIHDASRNIRPYCGDWAACFKSLGKKAKLAKDTLAGVQKILNCPT